MQTRVPSTSVRKKIKRGKIRLSNIYVHLGLVGAPLGGELDPTALEVVDVRRELGDSEAWHGLLKKYDSRRGNDLFVGNRPA